METIVAEPVAQTPLTWEKINQAIRRLPSYERWPGCAGMAIRVTNFDGIIEEGDEVYAVNQAVEFLLLTVAPASATFYKRDELRSLAVTQARFQHGAIRIDANHGRRIDLHEKPAMKIERHGRSYVAGKGGVGFAELVLNTEEDSELIGVANRMADTLVSNATCFRRVWKEILGFTGLRYGQAGTVHGNKAPRPEAWMPSPWVAPDLDLFQRDLDCAVPHEWFAMELARLATVEDNKVAYLSQSHVEFLADLGMGCPVRVPVGCFYKGLAKAPKSASFWERTSLQFHEFEDLEGGVILLPILRSGGIHGHRDDWVTAGSEVGHAVKKLPAAWQRLDEQGKWDNLELYGISKEARDFLFAQWLRGQTRKIGDGRYIPFPLVAVASTRSPGLFQRLVWRLTPLIEYGDGAVFVPPAIRLVAWSDFRLGLPFSVEVNLHADDNRILLPGQAWKTYTPPAPQPEILVQVVEVPEVQVAAEPLAPPPPKPKAQKPRLGVKALPSLLPEGGPVEPKKQAKKKFKPVLAPQPEPVVIVAPLPEAPIQQEDEELRKAFVLPRSGVVAKSYRLDIADALRPQIIDCF